MTSENYFNLRFTLPVSQCSPLRGGVGPGIDSWRSWARKHRSLASLSTSQKREGWPWHSKYPWNKNQKTGFNFSQTQKCCASLPVSWARQTLHSQITYTLFQLPLLGENKDTFWRNVRVKAWGWHFGEYSVKATRSSMFPPKKQDDRLSILDIYQV